LFTAASAWSITSGDALRSTAADTQDDIADVEADEAMTRRALDLLGSKRSAAKRLDRPARLDLRGGVERLAGISKPAY